MFLEYCSNEKCKEFVTFIQSVIPKEGICSFITCLSRRITQSPIPSNKLYIKGRHEKSDGKCYDVDIEDSSFGIFATESIKGNTILEASSNNEYVHMLKPRMTLIT